MAAREVSRFARNSREWQHLVEVCRVVDTVLIDLEAVYCPRLSNDRLLLGLKGSLNEYELDLLRQRSVEARRAKAQRGDLVAAPVGFLKPMRLISRKIRSPHSGGRRARVSEIWRIGDGAPDAIVVSGTRPAAAGAIGVRGDHVATPSFGVLYRMLSNPIYGGAYARMARPRARFGMSTGSRARRLADARARMARLYSSGARGARELGRI